MSNPAELIRGWIKERREIAEKWEASLRMGYAGIEQREFCKGDLIETDETKLAIIERLLEAVEDCEYLVDYDDDQRIYPMKMALEDCAKILEGKND